MNRRRALTIPMAYKLHREWNIPAETLIRPYSLEG
jgi:HTH-type transcriptional regulator/antitoxin HigA